VRPLGLGRRSTRDRILEAVEGRHHLRSLFAGGDECQRSAAERGASIKLPRGVHTVVARGREYLYYQANRGTPSQGPRIKLPNDPHSPEFWIDLRKAQGIVQGPTVTTIDAVCDLYEVSPQFGELAKGSQRQYRRGIVYARRAWGTLPADGLRPHHVRQLLDTLAETPGIANNTLGFLRALSKWGLERGHFDHSVTEGVKPYKSDGGHKPWTAEQCAAAERHFTGMVRRAYFLARYTGQRGSDVIRLAATFIDDGGFAFAQQKTGKRVGKIWVPIDPPLAAEMATWERWPGPYLRQANGKPYAVALLERHFKEARENIPELTDATLHGLRATRVIELRQRGHETQEIEAQVGMSPQMIQHYCRFANRKMLGKAAVFSLESRRNKNAKL
jgi:hypothetical protein